MLCTVVIDAYRDHEREEVHRALGTLIAADSPDWSRRGVYAYWDRTTHEILYLGLASDLVMRFAQHNGLVTHGGGNKQKEIDAYFAQQETLGFSVLLQGAAVALQDAIAAISPLMASGAKDLIAVGEGQLIESHRLTMGARPAWNKAAGSTRGGRFAVKAQCLLDRLAGVRDSLFVARRSLRDLVADPRTPDFEAAIHAARMRTVLETSGVLLPPDPSAAVHPDALQARIERGVMVRDGFLIEELPGSDALLRSWLSRLGEPQFRRHEATNLLENLQALRNELAPGSAESEIMDLVESVVEIEAPEEHLAAVAEMMALDYLETSPAIPS